MICDIKLEDLNAEEVEKRPGIIGYIVKNGDDLWTLAKRYRTTMESICQINQLENEKLKVGERVLIFKENVDIL